MTFTPFAKIHAAVNSEAPCNPYVRFLKGAEGLECYPEEGMYAQVLRSEIGGYENEGTENEMPFYKVKFNFVPFNTHNATKESSNYFDKSGNPVLTAREAGFYEEIQTIYISDLKEAVEVVLPDKEVLPFDTITEKEVYEVIRKRFPRAQCLLNVALELFAKGDVTSKEAIVLRCWLNTEAQGQSSPILVDFKTH